MTRHNLDIHRIVVVVVAECFPNGHAPGRRNELQQW